MAKKVHVEATHQDVYLLLDDQAKKILACDPSDKSCWGPKAWELLSLACEYIPCDLCREHCHEMLTFEHDVVNLTKGKPLYNPELSTKYLRWVNDLFQQRGVTLTK